MRHCPRRPAGNDQCRHHIRPLTIIPVFLKAGSVQFGSGYILVAFLRADLVERWHWLTENQLMDAIAVGQFTPGPVFTTATFLGYVLHGLVGAMLATIGIFVPPLFSSRLVFHYCRACAAHLSSGLFSKA